MHESDVIKDFLICAFVKVFPMSNILLISTRCLVCRHGSSGGLPHPFGPLLLCSFSTLVLMCQIVILKIKHIKRFLNLWWFGVRRTKCGIRNVMLKIKVNIWIFFIFIYMYTHKIVSSNSVCNLKTFLLLNRNVNLWYFSC